MVRKYKRKKPLPEYTAVHMMNAVSDVQNGNMSLRDASAHYQIPKSTLFNRLGGRMTPADKLGAGRSTALTPEAETELAECLHARARLGYPCYKDELLLSVQEYVQNNNFATPFKDGKPAHDWYKGFMSRHPKLSLKKAELLQKSRSEARDQEVIYDFFGQSKTVYDENDRHGKPDFHMNCDETAVPLDPSKKRGVSEKREPLQRVSGGSGRDKVSVSDCVTASRRSLPPFIIYEAVAVQKRWTPEDAYPGTTYAASKRGNMEEPVFLNWFNKELVPCVEKLRTEHNLPNQHAVLTYDCHKSHYSMHIIQAAIRNKIILLKLPSHLTDTLQPLDVGVFSSFKEIWDARLVDFGF